MQSEATLVRLGSSVAVPRGVRWGRFDVERRHMQHVSGATNYRPFVNVYSF